jgi:hypothetical protein
MPRFDNGVKSIPSTELSSLPGFERVRRWRWVGGAKAPIREIFEFQALKGATYSARWGFSLDFVPLVQNGRGSSKRTPRSAAFDLCIDPIDELGTPPVWCSFVYIPKIKEIETAALLRIASRASEAAQHDFDRIRSISDVVAMFHERSLIPFRCFSLEITRKRTSPGDLRSLPSVKMRPMKRT